MRGMPFLALACVVGLLFPLLSKRVPDSANSLAWVIDLVSHWQWLFLLGLVLSVSIAVWVSRRWIVLLLAVPLPWLTASAQAPKGGQLDQVLAVASVNVNLGNRNITPLVNWLTSERIDVLAVFEVSPAYAGKLGTLTEYPFKKIVPDGGSFGIALLSRHPLTDVEVIRDSDGIAHLEAQLHWQGRAIRFVAIHPMPPLSPHYHAVRDGKLRAIASAINDSSSPAIVAGDLNATPWSSAFSGLAERGLRRATGLAPSWPAETRGLLGIPIDHVLVTPHWGVKASATGPDLGSDHLPVLTRIFMHTAVAFAQTGK